MKRSRLDYLALMAETLEVGIDNEKNGKSSLPQILRISAIGVRCLNEHGVPTKTRKPARSTTITHRRPVRQIAAA